MLSKKIKNFFEDVTNKLNEIIDDIKKIKLYIGLRYDTDDTISGRLNNIEKLLKNNLYDYKLNIEDILIENEDDIYFFYTKYPPINNVYIKIYDRNDIIQEVAEIENEDISISNKKIEIESYVFDNLQEFDDLYVKIIYIYKEKIIE